MSEPLEIRRVPGQVAWQRLSASVAALLAGVLLTGASVGAVVIQDLGRTDQLQALTLMAVGVLALGWGGSQVGAARELLFRGPVLRLDQHDVWVRTGSLGDHTAACVPWSGVEAVEVTQVQLPPAFLVTGEGSRDLLRFVLADEGAVQLDPLPPYAYVKATALGLSPVAAALTIIVGAETPDRIPRVLAWLSANRPGLRVDDRRRH